MMGVVAVVVVGPHTPGQRHGPATTSPVVSRLVLLQVLQLHLVVVDPQIGRFDALVAFLVAFFAAVRGCAGRFFSSATHEEHQHAYCGGHENCRAADYGVQNRRIREYPGRV